METERSGAPGGFRASRGTMVVALSAVSLAVTLSIGPWVAAAIPNSTVLRAPFTGTHSDRSYSLTLAGCGQGKVEKLPYFYQKNGTAGFEDLGRTSKCKLPGDNSAEADSAVKVLVPIAFTSNGSHGIVVDWRVNASTRANGKLGLCVLNLSASVSYCLQIVEAYVESSASLYDATTGATTYPTNFWVGLSNASIVENEHTTLFYNYSNANPGVSHFAGTVSSWFNATGIRITDRYWLVLSFTGAAVCEFSTLHAQLVGGGTGYAEVNFATLGRGAVLGSITVN